MNLRVRLRLFTILSLVLFLGLGHSLKAQIETQVLAFPDLVAGGGWGALLTILALGTADRSDGQVRFFGQDAQPLSFNVFNVTSGGTAINGGAPVSTFPYSIPSGESRTFRITADQTKIGWLDLLGAFNPPSLVGRGVVSATLTFRFVQGGRVVSQIGMEATHLLAGATVPFNNLGSNRTGLALLSRIEANSITITAFEEAGNPGPVSFLAPSGDNNIGSVTIDLGRRQQTVRFIDEFLPETAGKRGFVMITGTARFIPLALNQDQVSLVLSTAAVLAEAFELDLTTDPEVDPARFRLRFFRFQRFITGVWDDFTGNLDNVLTGQWSARPFNTDPATIRLTLEGGRAGTELQTSLVFVGRTTDNTLSEKIDGIAIAVDETGDVFLNVPACLQLPNP